MTARDMTSHKDERFECKEFSLDHDQAGKSELDHRPPIVECSTTEATPAIRVGEETNVEEEEEGHAVIGNYTSGWCADKSHAYRRIPNKDVAEGNIEGCGDEEHHSGCHKEALGLGISSSAFEQRMTWPWLS